MCKLYKVSIGWAEFVDVNGYYIKTRTLIDGYFNAVPEVIPGPTIRSKAGETMLIQFTNWLPETNTSSPNIVNTFHIPDESNLHTHGLHISPVGHDTTTSSDNILINCQPW